MIHGQKIRGYMVKAILHPHTILKNLQMDKVSNCHVNPLLNCYISKLLFPFKIPFFNRPIVSKESSAFYRRST